MMKRLAVISMLFFLLFILSCFDSAVSMMDPEGGSTFAAGYDNPEQVTICHDNMEDLSNGICMFYGLNNRYPDSIGELEVIDPVLCSLTCPSCSLLYLYDLSGSGEVFTVTCPLPVDPNHGYVVNGRFSWPPGPPDWPELCHSNMMSLASGCAMFYGLENRYPIHLKELGISGVMENWDLQCTSCGELYIYSTDSTGSTYVIQCPLPRDPGHGSIVEGIISWN